MYEPGVRPKQCILNHLETPWHPGSTQEAPRKHPGGPRRHPGGTQEARDYRACAQDFASVGPGICLRRPHGGPAVARGGIRGTNFGRSWELGNTARTPTAETVWGTMSLLATVRDCAITRFVCCPIRATFDFFWACKQKELER